MECAKTTRTFSVAVLHIDGRKGPIQNLDDLRTYGNVMPLKWESQRLLWIGYHKNDLKSNSACYISQLAKDVINKILSFFFFEGSCQSWTSFTTFEKSSILGDIADRHTVDLINSEPRLIDLIPETGRDQLKQDGVIVMPCVHIWCKYGCIKQIFEVKTKSLRMSVINSHDMEQMNIDDHKWIEVPEDCLGISLDDEKIEFAKYPVVCVEYLSIGPNDQLYWPLAKSDNQWRNFEIGDIVDCQDMYGKIYQALIRCFRNHKDEKQAALHYINWPNKYDEWVDVRSRKIYKRHSKTSGPRPFASSPEVVTLHQMGFHAICRIKLALRMCRDSDDRISAAAELLKNANKDRFISYWHP